jgi:hypothetical protein
MGIAYRPQISRWIAEKGSGVKCRLMPFLQFCDEKQK